MTPEKHRPISIRELFTLHYKYTYNTHLPPPISQIGCECLLWGVMAQSFLLSTVTISRHPTFFFFFCMNAKWKWFYNTTTGYISNIPTITHLQNKNTKLLPSLLCFSQYSASGLFNVNKHFWLIFKIMIQI